MWRLTRGLKFLAVLAGIMLCSGPLVHCECEEQLGARPELEVDKTILLFEKVATGYPQQRSLQVTNLGRAGLVFEKIGARAGPSGPFSVVGARDPVSHGIIQVPGSIGPGSSIELVVEYRPATELSLDFDILDIITNDRDECPSEHNPCEIQLIGTGAPPDAELEVVCQQDKHCPPPSDAPVCQTVLDPGTNTHPIRVSFNFCEVPKGSSYQLDALLHNAGNIPLTMNGFSIYPLIGDPTQVKKLQPADLDLVIDPGAGRMLSLVYVPNVEGAINIGMDIQTNDTDIPSGGVFVVRALGFSAEPDIDVHPLNIPFKGVVQGTQDTQQITVHNTGTGNLVIDGLQVTGGTLPSEFSINPTEGFTIGTGGQATIDVIYAPQDVGVDDGSVIISSNDPDESVVVVTLGAEVRPDLDVNPPSVVEFINVPAGGSDQQEVILRNVGHANLTISDIVFKSNPGNPPVFGLAGLPVDFPGNPILLPPAESTTFQITFKDNTTMEGETGELNLTHDSPSDQKPYLLMAVNSGTPANLPPVAVIKPLSLTVRGLDPIQLDGSDSFDPDVGDRVDRYFWELFPPMDIHGNPSQASLTSNDQPQTSFTPDIYAKYIVRLYVFDTFGAQSRATDAEISVNP